MSEDCGYQDVECWKRQLLGAGWAEKTPTIWKSPHGKLYMGPFGAWKVMRAMSENTGLSLSLKDDSLAVGSLLDDQRTRIELYENLIRDIRRVLGDDGMHAVLLDLPKVIAARLALPPVSAPATEPE